MRGGESSLGELENTESEPGHSTVLFGYVVVDLNHEQITNLYQLFAQGFANLALYTYNHLRLLIFNCGGAVN